MDSDVAEVVRLELLLLEPEVRGDPGRVLRLLHDDAVEHRSSGRVSARSATTARRGSRRGTPGRGPGR